MRYLLALLAAAVVVLLLLWGGSVVLKPREDTKTGTATTVIIPDGETPSQ